MPTDRVPRWGDADELAAALTSTLAYTVTADDVRAAMQQAQEMRGDDPPPPADEPSPEAVDRALRMQEGTVLARAVLALRRQLVDVEAETLTRQTMLRGLTVDEGAALLDLQPSRELLIAWVLAARELLGDAPNYAEAVVHVPAVSMEIGAAAEERYVLTVQRAGHLTPHAARKQAEERVAELESELNQLRTRMAEVAQAWRFYGGPVRARVATYAPELAAALNAWLEIDDAAR